MDVLSEYDGSGDLAPEYIYGIDRMVSKFDSTQGHFWFVKDHLGSTRRLDSSSMLRDYYPFGEDYTAAGSETDYTFTGKEKDGSELYYFGARYYDARIGRFLGIDRFAEKYPSLTGYHYTANNPLRFIDVNGDSLKKVVLSNKQEIYVDTKIAADVAKLDKWAGENDISLKVNEDFRTTKEQKALKDKYAKEKPDVKVAEPGTSRHESGFALDIKTASWTKDEKAKFEKKAKELGMTNNVTGEPWHFQADPTKHGYESKKAAIKENQKHYKELTKEKEKEEK